MLLLPHSESVTGILIRTKRRDQCSSVRLHSQIQQRDFLRRHQDPRGNSLTSIKRRTPNKRLRRAGAPADPQLFHYESTYCICLSGSEYTSCESTVLQCCTTVQYKRIHIMGLTDAHPQPQINKVPRVIRFYNTICTLPASSQADDIAVESTIEQACERTHNWPNTPKKKKESAVTSTQTQFVQSSVADEIVPLSEVHRQCFLQSPWLSCSGGWTSSHLEMSPRALKIHVQSFTRLYGYCMTLLEQILDSKQQKQWKGSGESVEEDGSCIPNTVGNHRLEQR